MLRTKLTYSALSVAVFMTVGLNAAVAQDPNSKFEIGVEQNQFAPASSYPSYPAYPAPKMIPQTPKAATPPPKKPPKRLNANINQQQQQPQRPIQANIQSNPPLQANVQASPPPGVLPPQFLGAWSVMGSRKSVQARPEFQSGIEGIFTSVNSQTWNIGGGPGGYSMSSDTGVSQVQIGQCTANTAFVRYQHPMKNTMIQEAIVLQLAPDGRSFQGMQRITVMKQGEPQPRAQVTYNLMGQRR